MPADANSIGYDREVMADRHLWPAEESQEPSDIIFQDAILGFLKLVGVSKKYDELLFHKYYM